MIRWIENVIYFVLVNRNSNMLVSQIRERSLCLLNSTNLDPTIQPWLTISDAKFHPEVW